MLLLFLSCSSADLNFELSPKSKDENQENPAEPENTTISEPSTSTVQTDLTFYRDIRPILDQSCNACHWESGRSFNMLTHTYPVVWASIIKRDIVDGGKPPPTPNPTCREYTGGDWHLTEEDIETIVEWVDAGSPVGSEADAPTYQHWPSIGPFDTELTSERVRIPLTEGYHCYAFPVAAQVGIKGLQLSTNNEEFIHHSLVYLAQESTLPNDSSDFECSYSGDPSWDLLAGWRPGAPPMHIEEGIEIGNNSHIIVQTYYTPPTEPNMDNQAEDPYFSWGVVFSDTASVRIVKAEIDQFMIPSNDSNHVEAGNYVWEGDDATLLGIMPRTHLLGTGVSASLLHGDGSQECLFQQDGYDFGMPHNILFVDPPTISANDTLQYQCIWDNSEGNQRQNFHPPMNIPSGSGKDDAVCRVSFFVR